ncbi:MAG: FHA domain-containing protein [Fuerstiella sp.]|nr:FHA domain-containing protein [Fuerstiella sp.]MCP4859211.1 FHA domain-containing protein [Fuerstiella sp.]
MSSVFCENQVVAVLSLDGAGRNCSVREIHDGERLLLGSDESSDVRLLENDVAASHCLISAESGRVTVRDCYSQAGTFVDGSRISEIQLTGNAEVRIGTAVILVTLANRRTPAADGEDNTASVSEVNGRGDTQQLPPEVDQTEDEATHKLNPDASLETMSDLQLQLDQARAEIEVLHNRLATAATLTPASASDPYQEEMLELLRAEVMDLQAALAEQHQTDANPDSERSNQPNYDDVLAKDEAEKLVNRLEGLLSELQERDEQVATLTELLGAAEEASRAERDERSQLDAWLHDIEERFGCREQEWQSQREKLQNDVQTMAAERDRAEAAINADCSSTKLEAAQNVLTALRDTAESQRLQLLESDQLVAQLRREVELAGRAQPHEELVQLAEERAEITRQRQELDAARHEESRPRPNEATLKLQVLREHLKEIHQQEQQEKEERKLSSRIARLWSRIDGR